MVSDTGRPVCFFTLKLQPHSGKAYRGSETSHSQNTFQCRPVSQSTLDNAKEQGWPHHLNGSPGLCLPFSAGAEGVPTLPRLQSPRTHLPSGSQQHRYSAVSAGSGCTGWGAPRQRTAGSPSRPVWGPPWCSLCRWKGRCCPGRHLTQPSLGGGGVGEEERQMGRLNWCENKTQSTPCHLLLSFSLRRNSHLMGQVLGQSPGPMANRDILNGHTQRQLILQPAQEAIPLTRDLPHFSGFAAIFS